MSCRRRGALMSQAMEQENDDVPQDGHRLRRRSLADPAGILAERPVAHAVQAVLDPPVAAGQPQERLGPAPVGDARPRSPAPPRSRFSPPPAAPASGGRPARSRASPNPGTRRATM